MSPDEIMLRAKWLPEHNKKKYCDVNPAKKKEWDGVDGTKCNDYSKIRLKDPVVQGRRGNTIQFKKYAVRKDERTSKYPL